MRIDDSIDDARPARVTGRRAPLRNAAAVLDTCQPIGPTQDGRSIALAPFAPF
jgi:hypothetical protein